MSVLNQNIIPEIKQIIAQARDRAIRSVDFERVLMYWKIGERIFNEEQQGKERADYGTYLVKYISEQLEPEFGSAFSYRQLARFRQFYKCFPIVSALQTQLSWTHYKSLLSIDNQYKREFYIAEATKNNWSVRQLERQINTQLFERLLISNDIENVLAVARNEKIPTEKQLIEELQKELKKFNNITKSK